MKQKYGLSLADAHPGDLGESKEPSRALLGFLLGNLEKMGEPVMEVIGSNQ